MVGKVTLIIIQITHLYPAFEHRDGNFHRQKAQEWKGLDDGEQDDFFKMHGARYFELSWLSYFDPVRMTVVDPMHNILLGEPSIASTCQTQLMNCPKGLLRLIGSMRGFMVRFCVKGHH